MITRPNFKIDVCCCWREKKAMSKRCTKCSKKMNKIRNASLSDTEHWRECKIEFDIMVKKENDFNNNQS
jgi:hypothetical protein